MPTKKKYGLGKATQTHELALPSGNTCLVTRPGVQGLIKAGTLDSLDSLTSIVQIKHIDANDPKAMARAVREAGENPKALLEGMDIVDKVVVQVVQQPPVSMPPEDDAERDDETIYVDDVDLEDKMFIFQFVVGGTRDLETFRRQQQELMGSVSAISDV